MMIEHGGRFVASGITARSTWVRAGVILLCSALIGAMSGCSKSANTAGKTLRIGIGSMPPAVGDPYNGVTLPATLLLQAIFDTVTTPDGHGGAAPSLATAWKSESASSWVFTLRPGVQFSDGEPLNADALVESVKHMTSPKGRGETIGSTLSQIESAERIDDQTVRVKLNQPDPLFPLHASVWRVPAPVSWRQLEAAGKQRDAIGSGSFVKVSRSDTKAVLKANPHAWRKPGVDGLELDLLPDVSARMQAFLSGAIDVAIGLQPESKAQVEQAGGQFTRRMTSEVDYIAFNTEGRDTPLNDPRVRKAMNLAVNRDQIARQILVGATAASSQLATSGAFGFDQALKPLPYDPAAAKALLAASGHANGFLLTMEVTIGETVDQALYFQAIASDLKAVGINVETNIQPTARLMQGLFSGKLPSDMFNWVERGDDPLTDYRVRSCVKPSKARAPFHCDPKVTELMKRALAEDDLAKRKAIYQQMIVLEQDSPPGILLWQRPEFTALAKGVTGFAPVEDVFNLHTLRVGP
jgi:peptide/nickel transport system substrate-binding protein